jgi:acyl-CoA synthetase (AMP-forming)/AMP-acid ligase II
LNKIRVTAVILFYSIHLTHCVKEIDDHNGSGELWVQAPSVVIGYSDSEKPTGETFVEDESGRLLKTGDEGDIRESPESGSEHVWIVD